jgi:hypothetical protein
MLSKELRWHLTRGVPLFKIIIRHYEIDWLIMGVVALILGFCVAKLG